MSQEYEQQKIMQVDLEREMKKSYIDYAMSVIVGRALPDVRDGLKPVHRRIRPSVMCSAGIIRTATHRFTTRWCVWRSRSRCTIR